MVDYATRRLSFAIRLRDGWEKARQEWTSPMGKNSMPGVVVNTCNLNIQRRGWLFLSGQPVLRSTLP